MLRARRQVGHEAPSGGGGGGGGGGTCSGGECSGGAAGRKDLANALRQSAAYLEAARSAAAVLGTPALREV